jgi:hypothetical protein
MKTVNIIKIKMLNENNDKKGGEWQKKKLKSIKL